MNEENQENAVRLLDIIHDLYTRDGGIEDDSTPFSIGADDSIILNNQLVNELTKAENFHLLDWAKQNILGLFE